MARAFTEMAQGYHTMQSPDRFAAGKDEVARASRKLDQAGQNDAAIPKLEPAERAALASMVTSQLKPSITGAGHELTRLIRTPEVRGDLRPASWRHRQGPRSSSIGIFPATRRPAVQIMMRKVDDPTEQKMIVEKAGAIVDRSKVHLMGWGTVGDVPGSS